MRKLLLFVAFLSVASFGQAQQRDPKAKVLLDRVANKMRSYKTMEINFAFSLYNAKARVNEKHDGKIYIKGSKYHLNMMGSETFFNGQTQWTYLREANEVNVTNAADQEGQMINPARIFTIYQKGYNYRMGGTHKWGGRTITQVMLTPVKVKDFTKIFLDIDAAKSQLVHAIMYSKDGNQYNLLMKGLKANQNYPDSFFQFDKKKYPKASINDMR